MLWLLARIQPVTVVVSKLAVQGLAQLVLEEPLLDAVYVVDQASALLATVPNVFSASSHKVQLVHVTLANVFFKPSET